MKLYDSVGPNPRVVRMTLAEKGVSVEVVPVDLLGGENRREPYLSLNPMGTLPTLVLDDGTALSQVTAICEYIDELHLTPPLVGSTPAERAQTRMWLRWVDLNIAEPMSNGYRFSQGLKLFRDRVPTIPQAADDLKAVARKWTGWLDGQMAGRTFLCGERVTLADLHLFAFLDFGVMVRQPVDPANANVLEWYERIKGRASAGA